MAPSLTKEPRFMLDVHLAGLARLLRMLGFDTLWSQDWDDAELARRAKAEGRILLTQDRRLPGEQGIADAYLPRAGRPRAQLAEVVARFDLYGRLAPFTRCMDCNAPVESATPEAVRDAVPTRALREFSRFFRCTGCGKVYWEGSHVRDMQALIDRIVAQRAGEAPTD
jgi:hypothetical protein